MGFGVLLEGPWRIIWRWASPQSLELGGKAIGEVTEAKRLEVFWARGHELPPRTQRLALFRDTKSTTGCPFLSLLLLSCDVDI